MYASPAKPKHTYVKYTVSGTTVVTTTVTSLNKKPNGIIRYIKLEIRNQSHEW